MFPQFVYEERRKRLKIDVQGGLILLPGNVEVPMNFGSNSYPFRQDSTFLYYFGLDLPDLAAVIDTETGEEIIYGNELSIEDIVWMGVQDRLSDLAERSGIRTIRSSGSLISDISRSISSGRKIHFLPPYTPQRRLLNTSVTGIEYNDLDHEVSLPLIRSVVHQRSLKDHFELQDMENTMSKVTHEAFNAATKAIRPGNYEYHVSGVLEGVVLQHNCRTAYPVICTIRGEIMHNHSYGNRMKKGDLLLIDAGAESEMHYATDITRTYPVGDGFSSLQQQIYDIVIRAQLDCIQAIKPGIPYRDIHFLAAGRITEGLRALGLVKGAVDDVVHEGAHSLFFPHGIGHMIGLDVHDMEDLGEDFVGYDEEFKRSGQFGTAYLRMAKRLKESNVITVEPGIYFIGALIDQWKAEGRFSDLLNYHEIEKFRGFGGIRIEDNVVVTNEGCRVIGKPIDK
jgi:Xaa-Pro aminopeptidase